MELVIGTTRPRRLLAPLRPALALALAALLSLATAAIAAREQVPGVTNFGRLTDNVFRGGEVSSQGLANLHDMGVKTVVDLSNKSGESQRCQRLGIKYYSFPMHADERPDDAKVDQILGILRNADQPVYVHCSAGKHRAGTISALYRIRVQGWAPERAWQEQQSYGFGPAKDHPELYEYVYGSKGPAGSSKSSSKSRAD